ncbi:ABC transporter ATP-binding protein [Thermopolyspora sp. NPDC052614]|uniref:ABC transporter ATP-binding protein n=1 Tax=Thermopolyspora sp. NPDC052614 TaxID=3155682 RepID=UPI003414F423
MADRRDREGIIVRDVTMTYERRGIATTAVDACDLVVPKGSWASLLGPSGCGKSTLLKILADIVRPTSGTATMDELTPAEARAARIFALVSQQSVMLPWRRLAENVELGLEVAGVPKRERRARAREAIELVGLSGFEKAYPHELSGGMRQRGAIARALTLRPRFLLMDEPFGALDELTRERLNFELIHILEETGATLLLVTHSVTEAVILSDTVAVMSPRPGRIVHVASLPFGHRRTPELRDDPGFVAAERDLRHALGSGTAPAPVAPARALLAG